MKLLGLRIITNFDCNLHCNYCWQGRKDKLALSLDTLLATTQKYPDKAFNYCTIMGGETTLLPDDVILGFLREASRVALDVRMTTNGNLLTVERLKKFKIHGLDGLNISVPALEEKYQVITRAKIHSQELLNKIGDAKRIFGSQSIRINIPLRPENMKGKDLEEMLWLFLHVMDVGVTLCEDIHGTYSVRANPQAYGLKIIKDSGYGLYFLDFHGKDLAVYAHTGKCNDVELIVHPTGISNSWEEYAKVIKYAV
jgi:molybdenum cofactor biosynthesis enzyme MoaA